MNSDYIPPMALLEAMMASAPVGLAFLDADLRYVHLNQALAEINGLPVEAHLGRTLPEVLPQLAPVIEPIHRQVLDTGQAQLDQEICAETPRSPGEQRVYLASYSPIRDGGGATLGVVAVVQDITERKQAEAKQAQLTRAVEEKNKELQSVLYAASHDLRSPLVNIQGFSQEMERSCEEIRRLLDEPCSREELSENLKEILGGELAESLHFIRTSAVKMDKLLAGLLKLSRLGRHPLEPRPVDVAALVKQILASMEYQLAQSDADVAVGALPDCLADREQLGQVFANLLDNAAKYCRPNERCRIQVNGRSEGREVIYCVADNGMGIGPEYHQRIFELFYRHRPHATPGEGLGLTIAQRILSRHGGRIWVESNDGQGATFCFSLPAAPEAA